jgi:hypothetical protein
MGWSLSSSKLWVTPRTSMYFEEVLLICSTYVCCDTYATAMTATIAALACLLNANDLSSHRPTSCLLTHVHRLHETERLVQEMRSGVDRDMPPSEMTTQQLVRLHQLLREAKFTEPKVRRGVKGRTYGQMNSKVRQHIC